MRVSQASSLAAHRGVCKCQFIARQRGSGGWFSYRKINGAANRHRAHSARKKDSPQPHNSRWRLPIPMWGTS